MVQNDMKSNTSKKIVVDFLRVLGEILSNSNTPRPRAALLMCLKKYSAIGNSAIGNHVVLCCKLILKQCY